MDAEYSRKLKRLNALKTALNNYSGCGNCGGTRRILRSKITALTDELSAMNAQIAMNTGPNVGNYNPN